MVFRLTKALAGDKEMALDVVLGKVEVGKVLRAAGLMGK
jgi:hypothetical protein